jgi:eukaryotic-like serine/threonine-protein kinase
MHRVSARRKPYLSPLQVTRRATCRRSLASTRFEKVIVIKRILPEMTRDPAFVSMLLSEARVAATLSHPNVVQTFDVGEVSGTYFIAMEHIHGDDIRGIVRQMKRAGKLEFPLSLALHIAIGVSSGLAYAHSKRGLDGAPLNIVHRDISPQNIVVTFAGDVKIVDFGVAKSDNNFQAFTESGKLKGKIPYMSPEQARGAHVDFRSDVFSAGIILYELTTGKRLFKGDSEYETMRMICERPYQLPSEIVPGYAPELERIVMKALTRDRDLRYQSARDMQSDLEAFARRERIEASSVAMAAFMGEVFGAERAKETSIELGDREVLARLRLQSLEEQAPMSSARSGGYGGASGAHPGGYATGGTGGLGAELQPPSSQMGNTLAGYTQAASPKGAKRFFALGVSATVVALLSAVSVYVYLAKTRLKEPAQVVTTGVLRVESDPSNASIWINGALQPKRTPALIEQLPLGQDVSVRATLDGYEPALASARIVAADPNGAPQSVQLKLGTGTVVLELQLKPESAHATLDGKAVEGLIKGAGTQKGLSSGTEHELVVNAQGYEERRVRFEGKPFETKRLEVSLDKSRVAAVGSSVGSSMASSTSSSGTPLASGPATATTAPPSSAGAPTASASSANAKPGSSAPSTTGSAKPKPKGSGFLNVAASGGWCNVIVDGVSRGPTPLAGIELSEGAHTVTCTSEGKTQSATVNVGDGATARHKFVL